MKRALTLALLALSGAVGINAQNYPMYHQTVTQDQSFTACPSGTASIFDALGDGKPMFIMVTGSS